MASLALSLLVIGSGLLASCGAKREGIEPTSGAGRDSLTVVVTDSGLGGLSIVADAARRFGEHRGYRHVDLVFYNALFTNEGGYNSLPGRDRKVAIFSSALKAFEERSEPDVLLVGCNTLSVLYESTPFAASTGTKAVGIVRCGVELIRDRLDDDPSSRVVLFGTETTIDEGVHAAALAAGGISRGRIIEQLCPQLADYIEQGFDSMETEFLIDAYVEEALGRFVPDGAALYVSFNCTHYGYALDAWRKAFTLRGVEVAGYLDPNHTMIDFLVPDSGRCRFDSTSVNVRVISMVEISSDRIESIGRYLREISPETEAALRKYELVPDLFTWREQGD